MDEQILNEVLRKLNILLDETNGIRVSGNGVIITELNKLNEWAKKIDTKLYWLESRDKERSEKK